MLHEYKALARESENLGLLREKPSIGRRFAMGVESIKGTNWKTNSDSSGENFCDPFRKI
jgi:hypothetical protein